MAANNRTWEERFAELGKPEYFRVDIYHQYYTEHDCLTEGERERQNAKMEIIKEFAARLCINLLKGTLKYGDLDMTWTDDEWTAFMDDEFFDLVNYHLLRDMSRKAASETS